MQLMEFQENTREVLIDQYKSRFLLFISDSNIKL